MSELRRGLGVRLDPRLIALILTIATIVVAGCTAAVPSATATASPGAAGSPTAIATATVTAAPATTTSTATATTTPVATRTATPTSIATSLRTITVADNGSTLTLHVGDRFALVLTDSLRWTIRVADPAVLGLAGRVTAPPGAQAVYEAKAPGRTQLIATGAPICRAGQPCPQFLVGFAITVVVA